MMCAEYQIQTGRFRVVYEVWFEAYAEYKRHESPFYDSLGLAEIERRDICSYEGVRFVDFEPEMKDLRGYA